ncbi:hypothetical protein ElyMa_001563100 [Elysia marginata]|uniref:Uncharacterized protein n=1 Tax=Elysia marginata TaxID=1093978 RepID=A0AAV4JBH4_9GAST|nr:hypothetical protein ElyMa_001563100 [Elysia marginata]
MRCRQLQVLPREVKGDRYVAHVPSGMYHQNAGKIQTLSSQATFAPRGCQDARKDTPDQKSKGGLKQLQQQRRAEATSTAKVNRSDVNSKGGLKRR